MPSDLLLVLPLLLPLYGALLCLAFWQREQWQTVMAGIFQVAWLVAGMILLQRVLEAEVISTQVGNWPAPFGITLAADVLSALILVTAGVIGLAVYLFSLQGLDITRRRFGYYPLLLLLQMGVAGVCLTGDLFNLYVWFELLLICCFALLSLGGTKGQLEGTLKYVTINFLASGLLLTGIGIMYSLYGSLNLAELAMLVRQPEHPNLPLLSMVSVFFLAGFGIKAAIFPLFFWLPASYHTPPVAISAFIAGLLTKVGIYTLIRLFTLLFISDLGFMLPLMVVLAALTMLIGVIGAAAQTDFKKILSFHIISQIGYMLMGLAIYTPLALAGSVFFIVHNILVKTNLFLISGIVAQRYRTSSLKRLGGVYLQQPMLSVLFILSALSLAGTPPSSGFWGKLMLARAGLEAGEYVLVGVSLFVSIITLFSMTKIWNEVFWKPRPVSVRKGSLVTPVNPLRLWQLYLPVTMLLGVILLIGVYARPLVRISEQAAERLLHIEPYTDTVLSNKAVK
ncbi:proton-conducting transporter transmembrane domain-containing protein [Pontibacter chinhatensis]|uniref:Multisubunit sodium/proton antiporter, MrpD subunit n=1 Tax=Pontibacter chinhatensis TaxID=1436961 RepID=A0A1I2MDQ6_9BACT|nr:proton-conducting transporter membrane subunit [Pontibacter chinhatensis]SFF89593.1 multisubunit sodium/proton antiporter, MrpD subunit [Pontibacter chinhatensis]